MFNRKVEKFLSLLALLRIVIQVYSRLVYSISESEIQNISR